jgi:ATP-binding cassette subfamily C protein CydCD
MLALLVLLPLALLEVLSPVADAAALSVRSASAQQRLAALLGQEPAVCDPALPRPCPVDTTVELSGVAAGWGSTPAVRDLDLGLSPGTRLGVVGPSGSGKSTLAAVLLRFLDPLAGRVSLGGTPLPDLALDDVRRTVVLVDDDPHVFASTVRENLRLARPGATDEELRAALEQVRLGPWLAGLPDGLDTALGEGAAQVSGGERARIGLARAVLADPDVLVLDEPTAHLDTATARAVTDDLIDAGGARTVVWITHTGVGLDRMDRVLDLDPDAVLPAAVAG